MLVKENEDDKKYMFIVDSVDALCRQNDYEKPFEDSEQVAGGALITSVFLKKMVLPIIKLNHMMILTSQVRVEVATNPYAARDRDWETEVINAPPATCSLSSNGFS